MYMKKDFLLNLMGIFLIVLGIIRILQLIIFGEPIHIFWLCNHVLILIGIAILFRNSFWLIAEFCFLFIGQFVWIVGFLLYTIFGITIPGNSVYLIYNEQFINLITILVHFLTLPLGFLAIFILGKKEKFAWVGGLIHAFILLPFIIYFGFAYNLDCFYTPCFSLIPNFKLYSLLVIPLYFVLFVVPLNFFVNWVVGKRGNS